MRLSDCFGAALLMVASLALAQGAKVSAPIDRSPDELQPGEFIWAPGAAPAGPLVMVISLDEQRAYVYRNGLRIGVSTVSTGKAGMETPTGVFTILQKHKDHKSNLYDDAPMPYMQRLTWGGVALHAGKLPGYPASHGCVRLPFEFARQLFEITTFGMTVIVAAESKHGAALVHPGLYAPVVTQPIITMSDAPRLSWFKAFNWTPDKSPEGPLSILVSTSDQRVRVIRNGIEIGRARISVAAGGPPIGTQAYVLLDGNSGRPSTLVPGRPGKNWQSIPMPGYAAKPGTSLDVDTVRRVAVTPEFGQLVYDQLVPGTTLLVTDASILPRTTGTKLTVITAEDY
jgi:hypothetical protein